jgi:hypothetical protein
VNRLVFDFEMRVSEVLLDLKGTHLKGSIRKKINTRFQLTHTGSAGFPSALPGNRFPKSNLAPKR